MPVALEELRPAGGLAHVTVALLDLQKQLDAGGVVRLDKVLHDAAGVLEAARRRQTDAPVDGGEARQEVVRLGKIVSIVLQILTASC